jgi:hypothetical protein
VPEVIAVIIGKDEAELVGAASSARAEILLNRSRDSATLSVFTALLFKGLATEDFTEQD